MKIMVFKDSGSTVQNIDRVTNVMTHSVGTGGGGIDLDIQRIETPENLITERIHLEKWDFYRIDI